MSDATADTDYPAATTYDAADINGHADQALYLLGNVTRKHVDGNAAATIALAQTHAILALVQVLAADGLYRAERDRILDERAETAAVAAAEREAEAAAKLQERIEESDRRNAEWRAERDRRARVRDQAIREQVRMQAEAEFGPKGLLSTEDIQP